MSNTNRLCFSFHFYWFNCPPLFKKWLDEVLKYGWAFGSKSGYKLSGKKIALAISLGGSEQEYGPLKRFRYQLHELTRPFDLTFEYVKADYKPFFAYYGIDMNPTKESIEKSVKLYFTFLESL